MVGRLALRIPLQVSAAAHTAGSASSPRDEVSFSDQLDGIAAYKLHLGETSRSTP